MTKAQMFAVVKDFVSASGEGFLPVNGLEDVDEISVTDVVDFLQNEIDLVNKRNSRKGTSKKSKENEPIKAAIVDVLAEGGALTVTEITKTDAIQAFSTDEKAVSNAKVTALLTQLRKEGKVKREYDKKVAYFSLGAETEDTED